MVSHQLVMFSGRALGAGGITKLGLASDGKGGLVFILVLLVLVSCLGLIYNIDSHISFINKYIHTPLISFLNLPCTEQISTIILCGVMLLLWQERSCQWGTANLWQNKFFAGWMQVDNVTMGKNP